MTIQPGESETIAEYESGGDYPINLLAVGATDRRDVSYRLVYDNDQTLGGWTQSPLGSVNDPFSFADVLGRTIPVEKRIRYEARLLDSADSSVDLAARLHTEV